MIEQFNNIAEIWLDIKRYERLYQISNYGRVKSLNYNRIKKERILKSQKRDKSGHLKVDLCKNGLRKLFQIHRLVLEAFVGPCPLGMEGCHNDGNPQNNRLDNLRWDTRSANIKDSIKHGTFVDNRGSKQGGSKLNDLKVRVIRRLAEDRFLTQKEIAKIFNIDQSTVSDIKIKRRWKHVE